MKLRIVEAFDVGSDPWFRLQIWRDDRWAYLNSGPSIEALTAQAEKILQAGGVTEVVRKEFEGPPQLLVDNPPD